MTFGKKALIIFVGTVTLTILCGEFTTPSAPPQYNQADVDRYVLKEMLEHSHSRPLDNY